MARSTYYYHTKRLSEPDGYDDARAAIRKIYDHHKGRYGYRRITSQLRNDGIYLNHKTVQKLMVEINLYGKRKKARYNTELCSNLSPPLNNVKPSNFWGSHQKGQPFLNAYLTPNLNW